MLGMVSVGNQSVCFVEQWWLVVWFLVSCGSLQLLSVLPWPSLWHQSPDSTDLPSELTLVIS